MDYLGRRSKDGAKSQFSLAQDYVKGESTFEFWNGDKYEGEYLATKQPLSIVRAGKGTYWSNDNSIYKGRWYRDVLEEADEIVFPDKSKFSGKLENMIAEGPGVYEFKEGAEIRGYLINNQFAGDLELKDPTGHYWKASNSRDESEVFFYPVQPFWQSVVNLDNFPSSFMEDEDKDLS